MRWPVALVLVIAIASIGGSTYVFSRDGDERFCTLGGYLVPPPPGHPEAEVSVQDGGEPGRDECDTDERPTRDQGPDAVVLGFDCAFRDVDGTVVATTEPNRRDGTCGRP